MKRKIIAFGIIVALLIAAMVMIFKMNEKKEEKFLTKAQACKMLSMLDCMKEELNGCDDFFEGKKHWYEKYMNYMYQMDFMDIEKNKPSKKTAEKRWTNSDMSYYLNKRGITNQNISEIVGADLTENKKMTMVEFLKIYEYLVSIFGSEKGVKTEELVIIGTSATMDSLDAWQAGTSKGVYGFEGVLLDNYTDRKVKVYVKEKEILGVILKVSDSVVYENVWIEKGFENTLSVYIGNIKRVFYVNKLEKNSEEVVGDIYLENGMVTLVKLKKNIISGKVLMVDNEKIEIAGMGIIKFSDNFRAYKTYGVISKALQKDILVGYDLTDFVISDGQICAALIKRTLCADNIRVLIMSTNYTSLFHERISVTCESDFWIENQSERKKHKAGEIVDFYKDSSLLDNGRIQIIPVDRSKKITLLSVERAYGNPSYRGTLEITKSQEGLVLVNDVLLEEYLYAVVPSEMPVRFGVEALKVQAVCARSYAYRHLVNNAYGKYGAHVDDSVNFQVYNNVKEQEDAVQAVRETYGQVATYKGSPITTYYYSTSCGHTSDVSVWGSNPDNYPYLSAKCVNAQGQKTDLSDEETFEKYINTVDESDFDYGYGYYRWSINLPLSEISKSVNEYVYSRYCANPSSIQVLENDMWISEEVRNIGDVLRIEIVERTSGGALSVIVIHGSEKTIRVENELNIRYLLCPRQNPITLLKKDTTTFYILPSAYCYFEPVNDENGTLTGYVVKGGGYGHGIGMSQNAVSNMVKSGMNYESIIKFFFEKTELSNVYDIAK